ncbi:MAG: BLUF domain-containing protein [Alphaproteobacteria bacterium]|nr:BLUF domain-containing protein [Alphaproteobacteria bacterium]
MISLLYVSSATRPFEKTDLIELLRHSRSNNEALGVTGILLEIGGNFMQALEGEESAVDPLFAKIAKDPRHDQVKTILRLPITRRLFGDWAMAFKEAGLLPPEMRAEISSFIDDARRNDQTERASSGSPAVRILERFAVTMR